MTAAPAQQAPFFDINLGDPKKFSLTNEPILNPIPRKEDLDGTSLKSTSATNTEVAPGSAMRVILCSRKIPAEIIEFYIDLVYPGGDQSTLFPRISFQIPEEWPEAEDLKKASALLQNGDDSKAEIIVTKLRELVSIVVSVNDPELTYFQATVAGANVEHVVSKHIGDIKGLLRLKE